MNEHEEQGKSVIPELYYCPSCDKRVGITKTNILQPGLAVAVCAGNEELIIQLRNHGILFDGIHCAIKSCQTCYNKSTKALQWARSAYSDCEFFKPMKHKSSSPLTLHNKLNCGPTLFHRSKTMVNWHFV